MGAKRTISFREIVPAGSNKRVKKVIERAAIVEGMTVRFYPGQQRDLHVMPYVKRITEDIDYLVLTAEGSDSYLSGDDDTFTMQISVEVKAQETLEVYAENVDPTFDYTLSIDFDVQYK